MGVCLHKHQHVELILLLAEYNGWSQFSCKWNSLTNIKQIITTFLKSWELQKAMSIKY